MRTYLWKIQVALLVLALGWSIDATAQTSFAVKQEDPTSITIRASWFTDCFEKWQQDILGDQLILTGVRSCSCGPGAPRLEEGSAFFGHLLPGTYTVGLYLVPGDAGPGEPCQTDPQLVESQEVTVTGSDFLKTIRLSPPNPDSADEVILEITHEPAVALPFLQGIQGSTVWVDIMANPLDPPVPTEQATLSLGLLPAGNYTLLITDRRHSTGSPALEFVLPFTVGVAPGSNGRLLRGRFRAAAQWQSFDGTMGEAAAIPATDTSALFWFFNPGNTELIVKVLDACSITGTYWIFAAGMTNVAVEITIEDTLTGEIRRYVNPLGTPFVPVQDTAAFACP